MKKERKQTALDRERYIRRRWRRGDWDDKGLWKVKTASL
jgi:hypothetical protein